MIGFFIGYISRAPQPIDTSLIEKDGGKFVVLPDGRILEYVVYGSNSADSKTVLQIPGFGSTC